jgi:hypothetical protein
MKMNALNFKYSYKYSQGLLRIFQLLPFLILSTLPDCAYADPLALRSDITVTKVLDTQTVSPSVRLARINAANTQFLYNLKLNGIFLRSI